MTDTEVLFKGELKQTDDGFIYLDVPDEIVHGFLQVIDDKAKKPPYFTKKFNNVGAHISVMSHRELQDKKVAEVGKEYEYFIKGARCLKPEGWDEMKKVWFLVVGSPGLEKLRQKYGLSKLKHGHDFHITIGVQPIAESVGHEMDDGFELSKPVNIPHKLTALYEEAPEGIGLRNTRNLGKRIAKAMGFLVYNTKKNQRIPKSPNSGIKVGSAINSSPVPVKPRHRKFFGFLKPQIPY